MNFGKGFSIHSFRQQTFAIPKWTFPLQLFLDQGLGIAISESRMVSSPRFLILWRGWESEEHTRDHRCRTSHLSWISSSVLPLPWGKYHEPWECGNHFYFLDGYAGSIFGLTTMCQIKIAECSLLKGGAISFFRHFWPKPRISQLSASGVRSSREYCTPLAQEWQRKHPFHT